MANDSSDAAYAPTQDEGKSGYATFHKQYSLRLNESCSMPRPRMGRGSVDHRIQNGEETEPSLKWFPERCKVFLRIAGKGTRNATAAREAPVDSGETERRNRPFG